MVNRVKASIELSLLIFIMFIVIIGIGFFGISEIKQINKNSQELFSDRIIPMDQLGDIRYYSATISATVYKLKDNKISFQEANSIIQEAQDSINDNWNSYRQTYFTPDEKKLADITSNYVDEANYSIDRLDAALKQKDVKSLDWEFVKSVDDDLKMLLSHTTDLITLQTKIGRKLYKESNVRLENFRLIIIIISIIVIFLTIPFSIKLIKKYKQIINDYNLGNVKLLLTEKNYRNLIEYAGDPILILDQATNVIDLNQYACELFGYSREELLRMDITALVPDSELKKQAEDIERINRIKFDVFNRTIKRKDGALLQTEISNRLIEDKGYFAIIRDVTERLKSEEALRISEFQYRYLFDNNPAYIIIWDLETLNVLKYNKVVFQNYGYSEDEWEVMKVTDFRPQEDHSKIKEFAQMMLVSEDPIATRTWRHLKKNGEVMLMEISSHRIDYEGKKAILSLARDITEQVKIEQELAEQEALLHLFIDHSPASLAMFDNDMRYIATSKRWILDYNLEDMNIIGMSHYDVFPEITQEWKDIHKRCLAGEIIKREDDCFVRKDGSLEWLRGELRPWYKVSGEIGGIIVFAEVITEQKRAMQLFKYQFENSPDLILYVNRNHEIESLNRTEKITGKTVNDFIGKNCISILPESSQKLAFEALTKCFETKQQQEIVNELSHGRWVKSRFVPIVLNGEVKHVMIFGTDITKQKNFELKLLQSEEKYRVLTENISDAVLLVNSNFQIIYHNNAAERISGYHIEDVKGKLLLNFIYPEDQKDAMMFFESVKDFPNVQLQNQFRIVRKNGEIIWVEGSIINLVENENIGSYVVNYRDVTNRKKLEEQQSLITSIVDSSDDAIISKTLDGIITTWNRGAEKILGYKVDEIIGKHITCLIPYELKGEEKNILNYIKAGKSLDHYITRRLKKNGEIIDVSLTTSPIKDVSGNVIGASKIMRDISKQMEYEAELIRYNSELKKTNAELDRFVYSTSHDLRAPLKSMIGLINITKTTLEESDNCDVTDVVVERLNMLNKSAFKLDNFIEDILIYSRNARTGIDKEVIDLKELIQEVKSNLKYVDEQFEVEFKLQIHLDKPFISDRKRLSIVLSNILSNAYKYIDKNKSKHFIHINVFSENKKVVIQIQDNGIGIANLDKEKIFDMFYRSTILSTGSGLGLYIAKETIEKLGGTIKVDSEINQGTTFTIEITNKDN